jgi:hypothetical protein
MIGIESSILHSTWVLFNPPRLLCPHSQRKGEVSDAGIEIQGFFLGVDVSPFLNYLD